MKLLITCLFIFFLNNSVYSNVGSDTGFKLPRFVSIKSDDANIRIGPSKNYPINIKLIHKNYPLKIIDEYLEWRQIIDFKSNTGWIHKSLITGTRYGIIINNFDEPIKIFNNSNGNIIGEIFSGNIVQLKKCKIEWCLISINNKQGWISKNNIWGTEDKEVFNIGYMQIFTDYYWKIISYLKTNYL